MLCRIKEILNFKSKSLIKRTLLIIVLYACLMLIMISIFVFAASYHNTQKENNALFSNLMDSTSLSLEYTLLEGHEIISQLGSEPSLFSHVILGAENSSYLVKTMGSLAISRAQHVLIDALYLYIPKSNTIITSSYIIQALEESCAAPMVLNYLNKRESCTEVMHNGWIARIYYLDDAVYLVREFPVSGDNCLGILFCRLNWEVLSSRLDTLRDTAKEMCILTSQGTVLDALSQPISEDSEKVLAELLQSGQKQIKRGGVTYHLTTSEVTGWRCFAVSSNSTILDSSNILQVLFPVVAVILAYTIMLTRSLKRYLLDPVRRISQKSMHLGEMDAVNNELMILESAINNYTLATNQYNQTVDSIIPYIQQHFFVDLCKGKTMDLNYISTCLDKMQSRISMTGYYGVIVMRPVATHHNQVNNQQVLAKVKQYLRNMDHSMCRYHVQPCGVNEILIVLNFSRSLSHPLANLYLKGIVQDISITVIQDSDVISLGASFIGQEIQKMHFLYEDALSNLQTGEERNQQAAQIPQSDDSEGSETIDMMQCVNRIYKVALNSGQVAAREVLTSVTNQWYKDCIDETKHRDFCLKFVDIMYKQLIEHDTSFSELFAVSNQMYAELSQMEEKNEMFGKTQEIASKYISLLLENRKKRSNKYVLAIQEYIEKNYQDPNLSLDDIAAELDANPSYLSKTFRSNMDIRFIEYLNQFRVEKAKNLLLETDYSVKDIAGRTGFNSDQNFIRVFKKYVYLTPAQYRASKKEKSPSSR